MEKGRTRSHYDAIEVVFPDIIHDQFLTGIGAHVFVFPGNRNMGQCARVRGDRLHIDVVCNIMSTMANVESNSDRAVGVIRHGLQHLLPRPTIPGF